MLPVGSKGNKQPEEVMKKWTGTKGRTLLLMLLSFVITGIYFIFIYQKIPFIYDINDDVAMRNVAAGVITGTPDAHLLHVKYCLGLLIAGMYRIVPGLDWYGITMIGIILLAFSMILYRGLAAERGFSVDHYGGCCRSGRHLSFLHFRCKGAVLRLCGGGDCGFSDPAVSYGPGRCIFDGFACGIFVFLVEIWILKKAWAAALCFGASVGSCGTFHRGGTHFGNGVLCLRFLSVERVSFLQYRSGSNYGLL